MNILFNRKQIGFAISCALTMAAASPVANAEKNLFAREYVTDELQNVITSDYGECWHTGSALPLLENSVPCKASFAALEIPPTAAPAPVPEATVMSFGVDTMFDFDKATLSPSACMELDAFIGKLSEMDPESITIIGHADRIGSDSYNQDLSERRAQAVKSYMIDMGIPADGIQAYGMGETQQVTKGGECAATSTNELILCLQPNRRVEAKVVGRNNAQSN